MQAVVDDEDWTTHAVVDRHEPMDTYKARDIFRKMAEAAHLCGDPGIQYDTTINDWHTSAQHGPDLRVATRAPSTCSSTTRRATWPRLNLMKFVDADGEFDVEAYRYAAKVTITAQEILVDNASLPDAADRGELHKFRPLGLGYANLGALLMSRGLAYDSDEGRNYAAALTAIMHGEAYRQSASSPATTAARSAAYDENREPFLRVIDKHRDAAYRIPTDRRPAGHAQDAARVVYDEALELGEQHGYRNAQVTVLAPTGTIAFMMDCDTTGVEPDIALIKYKKLVGEGFLKIVNQTVPAALQQARLRRAEEVEEILAYINERETIEGAPHLKPEHLPVFDCAFKPVNGERSIHYMGHVRMMGAIQPFISRRDQQDRQHARGRHGRGDREGLPRGLEAGPQGDRDLPRQLEAQPAAHRPARRRTATTSSTPRSSRSCRSSSRRPRPRRRSRIAAGCRPSGPAVTHKFDIAGHEGYITVGLYPDGQPGEIFLKMAKEGSTVIGPDGLLRDDRLAWRSSTACRCATSSTSSPTSGSSRRASPATRRSRSPSRSWTTSSGGSARGSSAPTTRPASGLSTGRASFRISPAGFGSRRASSGAAGCFRWRLASEARQGDASGRTGAASSARGQSTTSRQAGLAVATDAAVKGASARDCRFSGRCRVH